MLRAQSALRCCAGREGALCRHMSIECIMNVVHVSKTQLAWVSCGSLGVYGGVIKAVAPWEHLMNRSIGMLSAEIIDEERSFSGLYMYSGRQGPLIGLFRVAKSQLAMKMACLFEASCPHRSGFSVLALRGDGKNMGRRFCTAPFNRDCFISCVQVDGLRVLRGPCPLRGYARHATPPSLIVARTCKSRRSSRGTSSGLCSTMQKSASLPASSVPLRSSSPY